MLRLYFEVMRLRTALAPVLAPFTKTSNNQLPTIDAIDVLLAWWYGLALNIERLEHLTRYQRDPLLSRLLGVATVPVQNTRRRLFQSVTCRPATEVSEVLM